jgi:nicotinamidase-related amidase
MSKLLVIVDMLNDFIDEKGALFCGPGAREIIPAIKKKLEMYRKNYKKDKNLIVFLQDSHMENDLEFKRFPKHSVNGTWGSEIIPELKPKKDEIIVKKKRYSGFYKTSLDGVLEFQNLMHAIIDEVEVVGVCTSICIMDTVGDFANRDYKIKVPKNCIADFDPEMHAFALKRMSSLYGADIS